MGNNYFDSLILINIDFIKNLSSKLSDLNEKEISSLLKSGEKVNVKEMIQTIIKEFKDEKEWRKIKRKR